MPKCSGSANLLDRFLAKPKMGATLISPPLSSVNSSISEREEQMHTDLEPFVDLDEIAAPITNRAAT